MIRRKIDKLLAERVYSQNWKTVFNKLDAKYTNKVIDLVAEQEIYRQERTQDFFVKTYQLYEKIKNDYINKNFDNLNEYADRLFEYCNEYENAEKDIKENMINISVKIQQFYDCIADIVCPYAKDYDEFYDMWIRIKVLSEKFIHVSLSLDFDERLNPKIAQDCYILIQELLELGKKSCINYENITTIKNNDNDYKKIFDYKKMNKLARDNGYIFKRQDATDHAIYMHSNTNKIVVIPQHNLGYGLMISIQKQIKENSVA